MLKAILCILTASLLLVSCGASNISEAPIPVIVTQEKETDIKNNIDDVIFLGESTTYHLKSRGVLSGGKETKQVWAPKSGTLMLDPSICDCRIIYPETNEEISLEEALQKKSPKIMLLTFGLNGATNFVARGDSYFKHCYQKLIDLIKKSSPNTRIIINSCFPVAQNMDMSRYTIDSKVLNSYIENLNVWAQELAVTNSIDYTDSASVIKDSNGFLSPRFQVDDGYHLNSSAYKLILEYLNNYLQKKEK